MTAEPSRDASIVCIPHAGAGPSMFARWRQRLGDRLVVVELPGREALHGQAPLRSIEAMAQVAVRTMAGRGLVGATLFGHSMGALVAYEAARALQGRRPEAIARLVVSGSRTPEAAEPSRLSSIADDREFMRAVAAFGGIPDELVEDPALFAYALPVLRADLAAVDAYRHRPGPPLRIPVVALGADGDPLVPVEALSGWRACTEGGADVHVFRGGHFFIHQHTGRILDLLDS